MMTTQQQTTGPVVDVAPKSLVTINGEVYRMEDLCGTVAVTKIRTGETHTVTMFRGNATSCTCGDYIYRKKYTGGTCKHGVAAAVWLDETW